MVDVSSYKIIKCIKLDCNNLPLFNLKGKRAIYCELHLLDIILIQLRIKNTP